jgi:hypothetical protein
MRYLFQRLTEASSAAGFASVLAGIQAIASGNTWVGVGTICAGIAAILIPGGRAV